MYIKENLCVCSERGVGWAGEKVRMGKGGEETERKINAFNKENNKLALPLINLSFGCGSVRIC